MEYSVNINEAYNKGNVLGYASVVFNDCFQVRNIAIMLHNRTGEWFVSMPSCTTGKNDKNGTPVYRNVCNPITAEFRARLYEDILIAFHDATQGSTHGNTEEHEVTETNQLPKFEVKVSPLEGKNGSVCAYASIILDDCFAINSVKLIRTGDKMFLSMPSYKTDKVDDSNKPIYREICYPTKREFHNLLRAAVIKEYNRQMKEKQVTADSPVSRKVSSHGRHR